MDTANTDHRPELALNDRLLSALTRHALDLVAILDREIRVRYHSPSIYRVLGYQPEELTGRSVLEFVHEDDRPALIELFRKNVPNPGAIAEAEFRYKHKNGQWRVIQSIATNLLHDPEVAGIVVNSRDITNRYDYEAELRTSNERFANAFEYAAIGMALVSTEGRWLKVNRSLCNLIGYSHDELMEMTFQDITHPDDLDLDLANVQALLDGSISYFHMEKRYFHRRGQEIWVQLAVSLVRDNNGKPVHFVSQVQDITERKVAEQRLVYGALHDSLTGLANRALLLDHLEGALNRFKRDPNKSFALILADLDRFKNINDTLGHPAGDEVLLEIARRFQSAVRTTDTVARLGGDEFAILLDDLSEDYQPTRVAQRLLNVTGDPIKLANTHMETNVSLGVVVATPGHQSTAEIVRDADIALYRAKSAGRGNYQVFDIAMHTRIRENMELEAELRQAIRRNELSLHLQPIVCMTRGNITAFEALLRWNNGKRGMISPAQFIPLAEESGLILDLGEWVTERVCKILNTWPGGSPPPISINVSAMEMMRTRQLDFSTPGGAATFDSRLTRIAEENQLPPGLLRLEITESALMEDPEYAARMLRELSDKGFRLLLDDFGTGYSSLSYLQNLPFYQVKLDSSFTASLQGNSRSFQLMQGIVTLAHSLGMEVVAEGIETREQLLLVRQTACDCSQGYYISRPLPVEEAQALYKAGKTW